MQYKTMGVMLDMSRNAVMKVSQLKKYIESVYTNLSFISVLNISLIKGTPITRYDVEKKVVYLEYPDGHIEYAKEA